MDLNQWNAIIGTVGMVANVAVALSALIGLRHAQREAERARHEARAAEERAEKQNAMFQQANEEMHRRSELMMALQSASEGFEQTNAIPPKMRDETGMARAMIARARSGLATLPEDWLPALRRWIAEIDHTGRTSDEPATILRIRQELETAFQDVINFQQG
ncbi:hypothetical protein AB0F17_14710 [Nonomuraea sp. NPDC026600]|uniref:hypothetical protein n=1 Tax=Nonomuraea sp. NPDC026600 TaxID=3155363 RepID=UPI0033FA5DC6